MAFPVEGVNGVLIFKPTEIWLANCLVNGVCHMHKLLISTIFAATTVTTFPSEAKSKLERHICRGEFMTGSLDSGIGDCVFISHDPTTHLSTTVNRKITCQMNNDCEVEALAAKNGNGDWEIEKVISVKDHGPMKR